MSEHPARITRRSLLRAAAVTTVAAALPWTPSASASVHDEVELPLSPDGDGWNTSPLVDTAPFTMVGAAADTTVHVRTSPQAPWTPLHAHGGRGLEPVWTGPATQLQVRARGARSVRAVLVDSRPSTGEVQALSSPVHEFRGVDDVVLRNQWGADETLRHPDPHPTDERVRYAVLHHTATGNGYGPSDGPAVVRGIYRYHTLTYQWRDIGYNFLVDRYGRVYEGRAGSVDAAVRGAHARGFNRESLGVALLGSHADEPPTDAALASAAAVVAWAFARDDVDPHTWAEVTSGGSDKHPRGEELQLPRLVTHGDLVRTTCPGAAALGQVDDVRRRVVAHHDAGAFDGSAEPPSQLLRLGGADAVETAVLVSQEAFPAAASATVAVLATDRVFADAAAAGPLAGADGPVLLTSPDELDRRTLRELRRVLDDEAVVYLLGGEAALPGHVEAALAEEWHTRRLAGRDRVETSVAVAREVIAERGGRQVAVLARAHPDTAWADGLTAGAYAARHRTPLLLTPGDRLPPQVREALDELDIRRTVVVGGTQAVSAQVEEHLPDPQRVAGADRAETALRVAVELWGAAGSEDRGGTLIVSGGWREAAWKDALVAAPLSARRDAPVLVVRHDAVPAAVAEHLDDYGGDLVVIGGDAAVDEPTAQRALDLVDRT